MCETGLSVRSAISENYKQFINSINTNENQSIDQLSDYHTNFQCKYSRMEIIARC